CPASSRRTITGRWLLRIARQLYRTRCFRRSSSYSTRIAFLTKGGLPTVAERLYRLLSSQPRQRLIARSFRRCPWILRAVMCWGLSEALASALAIGRLNVG